MFPLLQAVVLGIIEGLTEFLPVSSTGHLIISERLLHFHDVAEMFTVVIQVGAIAAVIWYYRRDLWSKLSGLLRRERPALRFWLVLVIGTIPAGLLGLLLDNAMQHLAVPAVVAVALIVGGVILWLVDRQPVTRQADLPQLEKLRPRQAWLVGLAQCVALVPGVSRSGATIIGGLLTGLDRATATAFSFYLSIPVLVLASGFKLLKDGTQVGAISGGVGAVLVGLVAAFVTALLAVSWLLRYIAHHNFKLFAYYRIALGVVILLALIVAR